MNVDREKQNGLHVRDFISISAFYRNYFMCVLHSLFSSLFIHYARRLRLPLPALTVHIFRNRILSAWLFVNSQWTTLDYTSIAVYASKLTLLLCRQLMHPRYLLLLLFFFLLCVVALQCCDNSSWLIVFPSIGARILI